MRRMYEFDYVNSQKAYDAQWSATELEDNLDRIRGDQSVLEIEDYLAGRTDLKILDVGCGMGRTVEHFSGLGYNVVGIDIASEGLKIYRGLRPEAKLVCASATDLPFREKSFDLVMIMGVLYEIEDLQKIDVMLKAIEKMLSDQGKLIYVCQYAKDLWKTILCRVPFEKRWFRKLFMRSRVNQEPDFKKWVFSNQETVGLFATGGWHLERCKPVNQYYGAANWAFDAFHKRPGPLSFDVELEPRKFIAFPGRLVARFSKKFAPMLSAGLVYFQFTRKG